VLAAGGLVAVWFRKGPATDDAPRGGTGGARVVYRASGVPPLVLDGAAGDNPLSDRPGPAASAGAATAAPGNAASTAPLAGSTSSEAAAAGAAGSPPAAPLIAADPISPQIRTTFFPGPGAAPPQLETMPLAPAVAGSAAAAGGRELAVELHTIRDGDTLHSLAQKYLGDAGQADLLYRLNRDLLPSPEMLPIGARLRIPRAARHAARGE
jgi:nucleoid-associated protein YgaU